MRRAAAQWTDAKAGVLTLEFACFICNFRACGSDNALAPGRYRFLYFLYDQAEARYHQ
jgi:hypothetical protein